jgi:demethylmenaquinone methyltransferase/2-methoxy-6-polyprenyl-1,4-benzoquinol methylase
VALEAPPSPRVRHARRLFAGLASGYDVMSEILSFGQNRRWRRFLVSRLALEPGALVLDVATGTAAVAIDLVRERGLRTIGIDQSEPMLRVGVRRIAEAGLEPEIHLLLGQAERLPFSDSTFDGVTFTYLLRYVDDPQATLSELARVLRSGGVLASLEFHVPTHPAWRAGWWLHTRVGLPAVGLLAPDRWLEAGTFLGPSISAFVREHPLQQQGWMWHRAGMRRVRARPLTFGAGMVLWAEKG